MMNRQSNVQALDNQWLNRLAPSIFASKASGKVSDKYTFIPTIEVVDALRGEGWFPVNARQSRALSAEKVGYNKHCIRFRRDTSTLVNVGDSIVELSLVNSHDGLSSYQLDGGVYRLVCSNGMTVSDNLFEKIRVKHIGFNKEDIIEASYRVLEGIPKIAESVKAMQDVQLSREEQRIFAESALLVRYDGEPAPIASDQLLSPRRFEDRGADLWRTFNKVQENVIRGGLSGWSQKSERAKRITTREIRSIDKDITINKALWQLAEKMKELKLSA